MAGRSFRCDDASEKIPYLMKTAMNSCFGAQFTSTIKRLFNMNKYLLNLPGDADKSASACHLHTY